MVCKWLTIQEAADYLGVHRTTIQLYIKEDRLKVSRLSPKVIRICWEDLQDFAEGKVKSSD